MASKGTGSGTGDIRNLEAGHIEDLTPLLGSVLSPTKASH